MVQKMFFVFFDPELNLGIDYAFGMTEHFNDKLST